MNTNPPQSSLALSPSSSGLLFAITTQARTHILCGYTTVFNTPAPHVYPPHPDSPVCLFTQCAESQSAVGQKHPVSREEKLIALDEQPGDTKH